MIPQITARDTHSIEPYLCLSGTCAQCGAKVVAAPLAGQAAIPAGAGSAGRGSGRAPSAAHASTADSNSAAATAAARSPRLGGRLRPARREETRRAEGRLLAPREPQELTVGRLPLGERCQHTGLTQRSSGQGTVVQRPLSIRAPTCAKWSGNPRCRVRCQGARSGTPRGHYQPCLRGATQKTRPVLGRAAWSRSSPSHFQRSQ